jgi:hypothetical protein
MEIHLQYLIHDGGYYRRYATGDWEREVDVMESISGRIYWEPIFEAAHLEDAYQQMMKIDLGEINVPPVRSRC